MDSRSASSSRAGFPPESGGPLGVGALWRAPLGDPPENPADPPMLLGRLELPAAVDADYGQALGMVKDLASARAWLEPDPPPEPQPPDHHPSKRLLF